MNVFRNVNFQMRKKLIAHVINYEQTFIPVSETFITVICSYGHLNDCS